MIYVWLACANNPSKTETLNVVIVGGGAAGLAAAKTLHDSGIPFTILEREEQLGGSGIYAGRFFAVQTPLQSQLSINDSVEDALNEWGTFTNGEDNNPVVKEFLEESKEIIEWVEQSGARFSGLSQDIGAGSRPRIHTLDSSYPHPLLRWIDEVEQSVMLGTSAQRIEVEHRQITGIATDSETIPADIVVVAAGGFARDNERVLWARPELANIDWHIEAWPGMTGDSLELMEALEVSTSNTNNLGINIHGVTDPLLGHPELWIVPALSRALIVNQDGDRVFDETLTLGPQGGPLALNHVQLYAIFDSQLWTGTQFRGLGYNYEPPVSVTGPEFEAMGTVYSADRIDNLARQLSIEPLYFTDSIERYNQGIRTAQDEFGKDTSLLTPLQTSPFYAIPLALSVGKSFGGVTTTSSGQVHSPLLDHQRLYAAGEATGFLGGNHIGWGFSGSISAALWQGRQVGEAIIQEVRSDPH